MKNKPDNMLQNTLRNDIVPKNKQNQSLKNWLEAYFRLEVTTLESSQKVQKRDINLFISFLVQDSGNDNCLNWTPRLSSAFKSFLQKQLEENGKRRWNDRTVNRIIAHLKTFSKWIHKIQPFPLDNPMKKIKSISAASLLDIERAVTPSERRRLLDAADLLLEIGGISKDRHRYGKDKKRPQRKSYRPYRNRAIVYTLLETGMRRKAITNITLENIDFKNKLIYTQEKGEYSHSYIISKDGLDSIKDYIEKERILDSEHFSTSTLFLPSHSTQNRSGQLNPNAINNIWNKVCIKAGVEGKTPHSARHSVGKYLIEKTGNIEAVQRQLGHKNASYSLQYSRISNKELSNALDDRE